MKKITQTGGMFMDMETGEVQSYIVNNKFNRIDYTQSELIKLGIFSAVTVKKNMKQLNF